MSYTDCVIINDDNDGHTINIPVGTTAIRINLVGRGANGTDRNGGAGGSFNRLDVESDYFSGQDLRIVFDARGGSRILAFSLFARVRVTNGPTYTLDAVSQGEWYWQNGGNWLQIIHDTGNLTLTGSIDGNYVSYFNAGLGVGWEDNGSETFFDGINVDLIYCSVPHSTTQQVPEQEDFPSEYYQYGGNGGEWSTVGAGGGAGGGCGGPDSEGINGQQNDGNAGGIGGSANGGNDVDLTEGIGDTRVYLVTNDGGRGGDAGGSGQDGQNGFFPGGGGGGSGENPMNGPGIGGIGVAVILYRRENGNNNSFVQKTIII